MADAAITVLLETLSHNLLSCSDLISGAEDELRLLANEVESLRAFLPDIANKPKEDEPLREMERQIEEAVYDAQDTIDSYLVEVAAARSKIDLFPRHHRRRHVFVTELVSSLTAEARSLRVDQVEPRLEKARTDFPNMLLVRDGSDTILEEPHQILANKMEGVAATVLLQNISDILKILGGDLIPAAEEELRLLYNGVELLNVFLQNAANKPNEEEPFRDMEWDITMIVEVVQESIGSYLSQAAAALSQIDIFRRRRDLPGSSLAEVVRSLREDDLKPILAKARFGLADLLLIGDGSDTILEEPHQIEVNKDWSIDEDRGVGVEDEQATITDHLKQETKELYFISIIGVPGIGKTTLARGVYQSREIQYEFPTRIWVTVSQNANIRDVFLNILKEVTSKDMASVSDDELASAVRDFLGKRIFLLVLDDVWHTADFDEIREALPIDNRSSKVLITSRFREVGFHAMHLLKPHVMRFLKEDESWELLQLQVFGGLHICSPELIEIDQYIATKCAGVPLSIVLIGGILADQLSKTQSISALKKAWIEVFEYMNDKRLPDEEWEFIIRAIEYTYIRLPDELRNLCLYLGVFREDYEIPTTTLTPLWIAEGLIQHQVGRSVEDIAEENLKHLIQRKLVIVDKLRSNGQVKSCHLHDSVRQLCIHEGMQVNLFYEITLFFFSYSMGTKEASPPLCS